MPVNSAPASRPKTMNRRTLSQAVDQHVDADVDAGAHTVGGAELGHPHEHDDAQLLRPAEVELQQPVLQPGMEARGQ
jgi:hypothetical protein